MEKEYLELLRRIKEKGTWKDAARENMPKTLSLFGEQIRCNLADGFPLLTTKKLNFKNIVTELLWFLRGDTNIKYLIDNGCNIWNEDAYNYYLKKNKTHGNKAIPLNFEQFINRISGKEEDFEQDKDWYSNYKLGDCGKQYGWLWRNWEGFEDRSKDDIQDVVIWKIDQIQELINGLKNNPMSRRHIITAWNPATLDDMALNACHAFAQFNCRPIIYNNTDKILIGYDLRGSEVEAKVKQLNLPRYYLDCQMYQRSADAFLGVFYNIASYALLTHIIAKICNMEVGDLIISYGDVHIYEDHMDAVNEQLTRTPTELPTLVMNSEINWEYSLKDPHNINELINYLKVQDFKLENYNPQPSIKAKLSTGLK